MRTRANRHRSIEWLNATIPYTHKRMDALRARVCYNSIFRIVDCILNAILPLSGRAVYVRVCEWVWVSMMSYNCTVSVWRSITMLHAGIWSLNHSAYDSIMVKRTHIAADYFNNSYVISLPHNHTHTTFVDGVRCSPLMPPQQQLIFQFHTRTHSHSHSKCRWCLKIKWKNVAIYYTSCIVCFFGWTKTKEEEEGRKNEER